MKDKVGIEVTSGKDFLNPEENAGYIERDEEKVLDLIAESIVELIIKGGYSGNDKQ